MSPDEYGCAWFLNKISEEDRAKARAVLLGATVADVMRVRDYFNDSKERRKCVLKPQPQTQSE